MSKGQIVMDVEIDRTELEGLQTNAKATVERIGLMQAELDQTKDESKRRILAEELDKKKAEFEGIKAKVEEIKVRVRDKEDLLRKSFLGEIDELAESKVHGQDLRKFAEARDQDREERAQLECIADYMGGKDLQDFNSKTRTKLTTKKGKFNEGCDGIVLPPSAVELVLGPTMAGKLAIARDFKTALLEGKTSCSGTGDYSTMPYASPNTYMAPAAIWTEYKRRFLELPGEPADILGQVTMVPAVSGTADWVRELNTDSAEYGGVVTYWVTCEGDSKPATQKLLETFDIDCYELAAYTEITDRALNRSRVPLEQILASNFREAVNHTIETAILVGTATGQPDGIVDATGVHVVPRWCNTDVGCQDLIRLMFAPRRNHRDGAIFAMQDNVARELMLDRFGGQDCDCVTYCFDGRTALGYPVFTTHRLPAMGTAGDVIFGNFKHYILAVEQEVIFERSSVAGDMFRKNSTAFKIYTIVGGEVSQPRAFAQLDDCIHGSCCCDAGA